MKEPQMPKRKPANELTTEEALRRLFPKQAIEHLKAVAHEKDDVPESGEEA
jgi:hypothetical protein